MSSDPLEREILSLLDRRGAGKTICPSEVARSLGGDSWRDLMDPVRAAAQRLVSSGQVEITQHGEPVDPAHLHGPIRLRLRTPP